jgi:hypothetical protein
LAIGCSCHSDDNFDICPVDTPDFSDLAATVTEGSSVVVPLYAKGAIPSGGISGAIDTDDHSVAMLAPTYFNWSTSNYPPQITITGIDDYSGDSALRETGISGVVGDCGNGPVGSVYVVDRE